VTLRSGARCARKRRGCQPERGPGRDKCPAGAVQRWAGAVWRWADAVWRWADGVWRWAWAVWRSSRGGLAVSRARCAAVGAEIPGRWDPVADGVAAEDGPGVRCGPAGGRVCGLAGTGCHCDVRCQSDLGSHSGPPSAFSRARQGVGRQRNGYRECRSLMRHFAAAVPLPATMKILRRCGEPARWSLRITM
jgi:hypothetical protein